MDKFTNHNTKVYSENRALKELLMNCIGFALGTDLQEFDLYVLADGTIRIELEVTL